MSKKMTNMYRHPVASHTPEIGEKHNFRNDFFTFIAITVISQPFTRKADDHTESLRTYVYVRDVEGKQYIAWVERLFPII